MPVNKVVIRYVDGRVYKGHVDDFLPTKDICHIHLIDAPAGTKPTEVRLREVKGIFFVRDYVGNPQHQMKKEFDPAKPVVGRKIQVLFNDGELLVGTTQGYQPGRPGFFVIPADTEANTERCFVVNSSTKEVKFV